MNQPSNSENSQLQTTSADQPTQPAGEAGFAQQLSQLIQSEISRQVQGQLKQIVQEVLVPEIQKAIAEQFSRLTSALAAPAAPQDENPAARETVQAEPEPVQAEPEPVQAHLEEPSSSSLDQEFPPLEEDSTPITPVPGEQAQGDQDAEELLELVLPDTAMEGNPPDEWPAISEEPEPLGELTPALVDEPEPELLTPLDGQDIRIGIDFGTTTTGISLKIGDNLPLAVPIGEHGATSFIPSIVYFHSGQGDWQSRAVVGEQAESFSEQGMVIRSVKRCLGCQGRECHTGREMYGKDGPAQAAWCQGDGQIHIGQGETIAPAQVAKLIVQEALQRVIAYARSTLKIDLTQDNIHTLPLNLGCGAKFNLTQRRILRYIANELGFNEVKIENVVEEPILAGFSLARFQDVPEGRILIYDFGGGTFDVAILDVDRDTKKNLRVSVVATAGDNWLGGDDIDSAVADYLLEYIFAIAIHPREKVLEEMNAPGKKSALIAFARKAKEALSSNDQFEDSFLLGGLGYIPLALNRRTFEEILVSSGFIEKSLEVTRHACQLAYAFANAKDSLLLDTSRIIRHQVEDAARSISRVVLVGGVTKIPYIRQKLSKIFGAEKVISESVVEPVSAVAVGGAYPRQPQHYSIFVPPTGFYLQYTSPGISGKQTLEILTPYEYYDFHQSWTSNSLGYFQKPVQLDHDCHEALLCAKRAETEEICWHHELNNLTSGQYTLSISLDGNLGWSRDGKPPRMIEYPDIHPIQQNIRDAKEERMRRDVSTTSAPESETYEDMMRRVMGEN